MVNKYKRTEELDEKIKALRETVLKLTSIEKVESLNAYISGKLQNYLDVLHKTYGNSDEFIAAWFRGFREDIEAIMLIETEQRKEKDIRKIRLFNAMKNDEDVINFVKCTLERSYLKKYEKYSRSKPPESDILWIGDNSRILGIGLVVQADKYRIYEGLNFTGKYRTEWSNDRSETFKLNADYWTIGHILISGIIDYYKNEVIHFNTVEEYLDFFLGFVINQNSFSNLEYQLAKCYCDYVKRNDAPLKIPLLIPQFRYGGLERKHKYRLDFMVIHPFNHRKYGIEISPYAIHRYKDIYEHDIDKQNDFVAKYNIIPIKYSDHHLQDIENLFAECIIPYLNPKADFTSKSADDAISNLLSL